MPLTTRGSVQLFGQSLTQLATSGSGAGAGVSAALRAGGAGGVGVGGAGAGGVTTVGLGVPHAAATIAAVKRNGHARIVRSASMTQCSPGAPIMQIIDEQGAVSKHFAAQVLRVLSGPAAHFSTHGA
jgi:hypothetical protein